MTEPELVAHGPAVEFGVSWPWWAWATCRVHPLAFEMCADSERYEWADAERDWRAYHAALTADGKERGALEPAHVT